MSGDLELTTGTEWEGYAGVTFHTSGAGITREAIRPSFTLEWATTTTTDGTWGSWQDISDELISFNFRRQVADWYLGPRPATGSIILDNTSGEHEGRTGGLVRLTSHAPIGDRVIFYGLITDKAHELAADRAPVIRWIVTDWIGFASQEEYTNAAGSYASAALHLVGIIGASSHGTRETGDLWDTTGSSNQYHPAGSMNWIDTIGTLMRGDLGMFWVTREGTFAFLSGKVPWWDSRLDHAVAVLGTEPEDAPTSYRFAFGHRRMRMGASLRRMANWIKWDTPYATAASQTTYSTGWIGSFGRRERRDEVWVSTDAEALTLVQRLRDRIDYGKFSVDSIEFDATNDLDALNYASIAELADPVAIHRQSLEGQWDSWLTVPEHVLSVAHAYTPAAGWKVTLGTTAELTEVGD